mgnify:CR=1 FL=1
MVEVLKVIALLCNIDAAENSPNVVSQIDKLQSKCHKHYAVCINSLNKRESYESRLLSCMAKKDK